MSTQKILDARKRLRAAAINGGHESLPKWWYEVQAKLATIRNKELYAYFEDSKLSVGKSENVILQLGGWENIYLLHPTDLLNVEVSMATQDLRIAELEWENQLLKELLEDARFDPAVNNEK